MQDPTEICVMSISPVFSVRDVPNTMTIEIGVLSKTSGAHNTSLIIMPY